MTLTVLYGAYGLQLGNPFRKLRRPKPNMGPRTRWMKQLRKKEPSGNILENTNYYRNEWKTLIKQVKRKTSKENKRKKEHSSATSWEAWGGINRKWWEVGLFGEMEKWSRVWQLRNLTGARAEGAKCVQSNHCGTRMAGGLRCIRVPWGVTN